MLDDILLYLTVFVLAATPWVEILVVIPFAVGVGLNPVIAGLVAFAGNAIPIYLIVVGYHRFQQWWADRRGKVLFDLNDGSWRSGRRARAMRIMHRYGVPGVALASPILIGAHFGAVITLLVGARGSSIVGWMFGSLAAWTLAITVVSYIGIGWLTSLW